GELDLEVREAEFFGLLGPNGAGKTTTVHLLATLLRPTRGTARVAGHDVVREDLETRRRIGLVFQETTLDRDLTVEQNLRFAARLGGADPAAALGIRAHRLSHDALRRGGGAVRPRRSARPRSSCGARHAGRAQARGGCELARGGIPGAHRPSARRVDRGLNMR